MCQLTSLAWSYSYTRTWINIQAGLDFGFCECFVSFDYYFSLSLLFWVERGEKVFRTRESCSCWSCLIALLAMLWSWRRLHQQGLEEPAQRRHSDLVTFTEYIYAFIRRSLWIFEARERSVTQLSIFFWK